MRFYRRVPGVFWALAQRYVESVASSIRLVHAVRRDDPVSIWVGDSHSLHFNQKSTGGVVSGASDAHFVWHLGPRLMWSLGTRGFAVGTRVAAWLLNCFRRSSGRVVPIVVAGEIDVRCHLVSRSSVSNVDLSFVASYVNSGRRLASSMGAECAIFVVPVPPGADWSAHSRLPIVGSSSARIEAFAALRIALAQAVEQCVGEPRAYLLDATDVLVDSGGQLDRTLTSDGCHVNREGALLVHGRLAELIRRMERVLPEPGSTDPAVPGA